MTITYLLSVTMDDPTGDETYASIYYTTAPTDDQIARDLQPYKDANPDVAIQASLHKYYSL